MAPGARHIWDGAETTLRALGERTRLILDGTDGGLHRIELAAGRCEDVAPGLIVAAMPITAASATAGCSTGALSTSKGPIR